MIGYYIKKVFTEAVEDEQINADKIPNDKTLRSLSDLEDDDRKNLVNFLSYLRERLNVSERHAKKPPFPDGVQAKLVLIKQYSLFEMGFEVKPYENKESELVGSRFHSYCKKALEHLKTNPEVGRGKKRKHTLDEKDDGTDSAVNKMRKIVRSVGPKDVLESHPSMTKILRRMKLEARKRSTYVEECELILAQERDDKLTVLDYIKSYANFINRTFMHGTLSPEVWSYERGDETIVTASYDDRETHKIITKGTVTIKRCLPNKKVLRRHVLHSLAHAILLNCGIEAGHGHQFDEVFKVVLAFVGLSGEYQSLPECSNKK